MGDLDTNVPNGVDTGKIGEEGGLGEAGEAEHAAYFWVREVL